MRKLLPCFSQVLSPKTIAEILFLRTPQLGRCPIGLIQRDLRNCSVYNWEIYHNRKYEWDAPSNGKLWDRDYKDLVIAC